MSANTKPQFYRAKPVQAMQYDGTIVSAGAIMEWTGYRTRASNGRLVLQHKSGEEVVISAGNWLVKDDVLHIVSPDDFSRYYELVE